MPNLNITLPEDDTTADVGDYNPAWLALLALINGHLDGDNIEPGSLPWSVMDSFTEEISATQLEKDANSKIFRDEANIGFVASGLVWASVSGLNGTMSSGVAYGADGSRNEIAAIASRAFTASKDTYVDLAPNGSVGYTEVANGAASPSLPANYLRLAKVVTGASSITSVTTSGIDSLGNTLRKTTFIPAGSVGPSERVGGIHVGAIAAATLGSTGSKKYTMAFKPKLVLAIAHYDASAAGAARRSLGFSDGTTTLCEGTAVDAGANARWNATILANIRNEANTTQLAVAITSFDDDGGFTYNVTTASSSYKIIIIGIA